MNQQELKASLKKHEQRLKRKREYQRKYQQTERGKQINRETSRRYLERKKQK